MDAGGTPETIAADVVVVGAGVAGLYAALTAAESGAAVAVISATPLAQTASYWAQGGLAAALAVDDSPELHLQDTERAGRGLMRRSAAQVLVTEAPAMIAELQRLRVRFDADRNGNLSLGLEGGHSRRRIVHAGGSATGRRVARQLSADLVHHDGVRVVEGARAASLWTDEGRVVGVVCESGLAVTARATILATGGAAALWRRTTNPPGSLGIGILLARAAGAAVADMEFVQFHPTAVTGVPGREGFLITEAIRGEGATLHGPDGERFVEELAPRDEVSRAVWEVMQRHGTSSVSLDMRGVDPARFPNVVEALRESGLDPTRELVPVAPAAHYVMGGVVTDLDGATGVPGLYVVGESACTGLHGANRLASNSLSECVVFGARAAHAAVTPPARPRPAARPPAPEPLTLPAAATREALWRDAGIVRTREGLERLLGDPHPLARLVARCALLREETRGAHVRLDFPETDPRLDRMHAVARDDEPAFERWA
ncbi:MAG TPA: FAD-dependent oxidoreductase [Solirubrobacteraceae bacterium]|nr:FAD-dependent oxidoreductase [Solirubrobacteraceae bacterium]